MARIAPWEEKYSRVTGARTWLLNPMKYRGRIFQIERLPPWIAGSGIIGRSEPASYLITYGKKRVEQGRDVAYHSRQTAIKAARSNIRHKNLK